MPNQEVSIEFYISEIKDSNNECAKHIIQLLEKVDRKYINDKLMISLMSKKITELSTEIKILKGQMVTVPKPDLDR
jgi:hypothetical protein